MKNVIKLLCVSMALALPMFAFSQNKSNQKIKEITINSSIQCKMCVNNLESMFADYWAVKQVDYDLEHQNITVTYNSKRTSPKEIREKISNAGYDADDVQANIDSYLKLDKCCQKGNRKKCAVGEE